MPYKVLIFTIITSCIINSALALKCHHCKGEYCNNVDVPLVECNRKINKLPHAFESTAVNLVDAEYACVDLEYREDSEAIAVRQCHLVSPTEDLCEEIEAQLPLWIKLHKCIVKRDEESEKLEENIEEDVESSSSIEPSTFEPPSTEPPSTEPPSTELPSTKPPITKPPITEPSSTELPSSKPTTFEPSSSVTTDPSTTESTTLIITTTTEGASATAAASVFALILSIIILKTL